MRIRFQAEADLNRAILTGVIRKIPEIDFQSATTIPLDDLDDLSVLGLAAHQGRVLVSHDINTMESSFGEYVGTHVSPGLVLIP